MSVASGEGRDPSLVSRRTSVILLGLGVLGAAAFAVIVATDAPRAWSVLLVNFLFWGGLGQAGVALSAVFQVTTARWARPVKRLAEATIAFLPVSALLLLILLTRVGSWWPWTSETLLAGSARAIWLDESFLVGRQAVAFMVLGLVNMAYVSASLGADTGRIGVEDGQRRQSRLAPVVLVVYALVLSLQGFDLVMSLDARWFSTLLGGYFFVGNLYVGVAFLVLATVWIRDRPQVQGRIDTTHRYDLGRILFGFCLLWTYLFWSQYLVIWYGDLPEETEFVAVRTVDGPWAPLAWIVLGAAFVVPFVVLLSREVKRRGPGLSVVAVVVLIGMWLERFLLVTPSLVPAERLPLGIGEGLVTVGVGAVFVLSYVHFLERVPVLPVSDPLLAPPPAVLE